MVFKMANITINTEKFKFYADEIKKNAKEFDFLIDSLFNRIINVPTKTGEWMGEASNKFANYATLEKKMYNDFAATLYSFGETMFNYAENLSVSNNNSNINEVE